MGTVKVPVSRPGTRGQEADPRMTSPSFDHPKQERPMDLELARGIFLGLLALVGVGGIIDMFRE